VLGIDPGAAAVLGGVGAPGDDEAAVAEHRDGRLVLVDWLAVGVLALIWPVRGLPSAPNWRT
jgi:hypothetical protein